MEGKGVVNHVGLRIKKKEHACMISTTTSNAIYYKILPSDTVTFRLCPVTLVNLNPSGISLTINNLTLHDVERFVEVYKDAGDVFLAASKTLTPHHDEQISKVLQCSELDDPVPESTYFLIFNKNGQRLRRVDVDLNGDRTLIDGSKNLDELFRHTIPTESTNWNISVIEGVPLPPVTVKIKGHLREWNMSSEVIIANSAEEIVNYTSPNWPLANCLIYYEETREWFIRRLEYIRTRDL